jgi:hypothetical protein
MPWVLVFFVCFQEYLITSDLSLSSHRKNMKHNILFIGKTW